MGLKEMLFGGAEATEKTHRAGAQQDAQSADRFGSLQRRSAGWLGTGHRRRRPARRRIRYDKSIEDEQEKEFVCDSLSRMGRKVPGPLGRHLRNADSIAAITQGDPGSVTAAKSDRRWALLADLCERNDNTYTATRRRSSWCTTWATKRVERAAHALVPYLEDVDECATPHRGADPLQGRSRAAVEAAHQ